MFASPADVLFDFGSLKVYYYGVFISLAIAASILISYLVIKKFYKELDPESIIDLSMWIVPFGVVGARLYYVLLNLNYYALNPLEIFMVQKGGLSIHGAILGGIVAGYFFVKKYKLPFLKYADIVAYGLPIAQAIGRWGNFFNSEAYGLPTNLPWAVYIPVEKRYLEYVGYSYYHPTFLYESLINILIFLILIFFARKHFVGKPGCVFFLYLILYSLARIFVESIRIDSVLMIMHISVAIWASIFIMIVSAAGLFYCIKKEG